MNNYYVAKSYAELPREGEVYIVDKKLYVNVRLKSGKIKTVRAYTEKEYNKLYAVSRSNESVVQNKETALNSQKNALGFVNGYITIFRKNGMDEDNSYFRRSPARYARWWGWYIVSSEPLPDDLPEDAEPVILKWEMVGNPNGTLKPDAEVESIVGNLLNSYQFNVSIGQRLELEVTVDKNIPIDTKYGHSTFHRFLDSEGNIYIWTTKSKSWSVGMTRHIRGTVKETKFYQGEPQIVLSCCLEIKKES